MTDDKIVAKVTSFLSRELIKNMGDVAIFKNKNGSYELFNRYIIADDGNETYSINRINGSDKKVISSLKNAVSWCILTNRHKYDKAGRISHLDGMLGGVELSINIHKSLLKSSKNLESKMIYLAKLGEEQAKRRNMLQEITACVNESRYLQTQRFGNKKSK